MRWSWLLSILMKSARCAAGAVLLCAPGYNRTMKAVRFHGIMQAQRLVLLLVGSAHRAEERQLQIQTA